MVAAQHQEREPPSQAESSLLTCAPTIQNVKDVSTVLMQSVCDSAVVALMMTAEISWGAQLGKVRLSDTAWRSRNLY